MTFDDFTFHRQWPHDPGVPGWVTAGALTINTGSNIVIFTGSTRGGFAVYDGLAGDDNFIVQADVGLAGGTDAIILTRFQDPNNWIGAKIDASGNVKFVKMLDGVESTVASNTYTTAASVNVRIDVSGATNVVSIDGTAKITASDADILWGRAGFTGTSPTISNFKVGYDNNADGDIADAGDDLVVSDTFGSTSTALNADSSDGTDDAWDRAGNMVLDERFRYTYDAWNRLVKAQAKQDADVVIQTSRYDGLGRRIKKVVTHSGDLDGTLTFYYDLAHRMLETRDGSGNVVAQAYMGTRYVDEVVAMRVAEGFLIVNQDANWNVTSTTDLAGKVLERTYYTAYGQPVFYAESYFGDYDGDGDVDSTDDGYLGNGQTCWGASPTGACRALDFDQDRDIDADDQTVMTALVGLASTNHVRLARTTTTLGSPFAHQALIVDPEISQLQNRARAYYSAVQRFMQRDPSGYSDGLSLYNYLRNNSVVVTDPQGLAGCGGNGNGGSGGLDIQDNCKGWFTFDQTKTVDIACKCLHCLPSKEKSDCVSNRLACGGKGSGPKVKVNCDPNCGGCPRGASACGTCPGKRGHPTVTICTPFKSPSKGKTCGQLAIFVHELAHTCGWECPQHSPNYVWWGPESIESCVLALLQ